MEWNNLHELLRSLYDDMMPLAGDMAAVAKGLVSQSIGNTLSGGSIGH